MAGLAIILHERIQPLSMWFKLLLEDYSYHCWSWSLVTSYLKGCFSSEDESFLGEGRGFKVMVCIMEEQKFIDYLY